MSGFGIGQVVSYKGRRRRYAVAHVDCGGRLYMRALSGGVAESGPSNVNPADVRLAYDQSVTFTGAKADDLARRFRVALAMSRVVPRFVLDGEGDIACTKLTRKGGGFVARGAL